MGVNMFLTGLIIISTSMIMEKGCEREWRGSALQVIVLAGVACGLLACFVGAIMWVWGV